MPGESRGIWPFLTQPGRVCPGQAEGPTWGAALGMEVSGGRLGGRLRGTPPSTVGVTGSELGLLPLCLCFEVYVVLCGERGLSDPRELSCPKKPLFERNSRHTFILRFRTLPPAPFGKQAGGAGWGQSQPSFLAGPAVT